MDPDQTTPVEPVTPTENPVAETPPSETVVIPETPPDIPKPVEETKPPEPASPPKLVDVPIPNFPFPFNGNFPITFSFNAQATTDELKAKFQQWGINGHHGIDFGFPEGTEVLAVDSGKVIQSDNNGDYGISVTIQHPWGQSLYAHLKETKASKDQEVKAGELIGLSDQSGTVTGPHLHFGIKPNNPNDGNGYLGFIDPAQYLPQIPNASNPPNIPEEPLPTPETKPEEPKPVVQTPAPVPAIPEPTINIEPIGVPPQFTPPLPAETEAKVGPEPLVDDADVQKRAEELLKTQQAGFRILGNQAKAKEREDHINKIIAFAQEKKRIDNQQVRDLLRVSQSTATNYLTELVNKGVLHLEGKAKATVYVY